MTRYGNMFLGGGLVALFLKSVFHVGDFWTLIMLLVSSSAIAIWYDRKRIDTL